MTIRVPIEAVRRIRAHQVGEDFVTADEADLNALLAFAERFEAQPLPGMTQEVVAGELREIILVDDSLEAETFDLIRLNGRVFAPERVEFVRHEDEAQ